MARRRATDPKGKPPTTDNFVCGTDGGDWGNFSLLFHPKSCSYLDRLRDVCTIAHPWRPIKRREFWALFECNGGGFCFRIWLCANLGHHHVFLVISDRKKAKTSTTLSWLLTLL